MRAVRRNERSPWSGQAVQDRHRGQMAGGQIGDHVAADGLLGQLAGHKQGQAAVSAGMVDHHVTGLLTLQRREQGRVVQAGPGLMSAREVVPQLDRQARIITGEVVEQAQLAPFIEHAGQR